MTLSIHVQPVVRWLSRVSALTPLVLAAACADDAPNATLPELHDVKDGSKMVREAAQAVVRIQHPAGASGTGSFISNRGLLLTNNHVLGTNECAREGCWFTLSFDHQRGVPSAEPRDVFGVPEHADVGLDMVVLQVFEDDAQRTELATPHFLTLQTRSDAELIGSRVTVVGHPLGRLKKWSSGFVFDVEGAWFESTVFSLPGSSGSPLLDDEGHIVGLLHRGADGFDLLTRTGSNVSALATTTAALEAALERPLPATMISIEQALSPAEVVAHSDAFLAGGMLTVRVAGESTSIIRLLGEACDAGLLREDVASLEELTGAIAPCYAALDFIECRTDAEPSPTVATDCPDDARDAWSERLQKIAQRQFDFNGAVELSPLSFSMQALARSEAAGEHEAREGILAALDARQPVYDYALLPYLAAFGIESYAGESTIERVRDYRRFPYYERSAWEIALSALWLYSNREIERGTALRVTKELYRNTKISLGARLRIEEILYNSDEL